MSSFIEATNKRIDDIVKKHSEDISDLRRSVEFAHNTIKDLKKNEVDNSKLKHTANELKQNLNACEESLDYLDNQSRRNNLRIDGLAELGGEDWQQTEAIVKQSLKEKLKFTSEQVNQIGIERAHRIKNLTQRQNNSPRTVVVKFSSYKDRESVFKAAKVNRPNGIYFNEDFSSKVVDRRKQLYPEMMAARREGKIAYLSFNRLVIKNGPRRPSVNNHE